MLRLSKLVAAVVILLFCSGASQVGLLPTANSPCGVQYLTCSVGFVTCTRRLEQCIGTRNARGLWYQYWEGTWTRLGPPVSEAVLAETLARGWRIYFPNTFTVTRRPGAQLTDQIRSLRKINMPVDISISGLLCYMPTRQWRPCRLESHTMTSSVGRFDDQYDIDRYDIYSHRVEGELDFAEVALIGEDGNFLLLDTYIDIREMGDRDVPGRPVEMYIALSGGIGTQHRWFVPDPLREPEIKLTGYRNERR